MGSWENRTIDRAAVFTLPDDILPVLRYDNDQQLLFIGLKPGAGMNTDPEQMAKQVAGTMAIEGLELTPSEYKRLEQCASGELSITETIQDLIALYSSIGA